VTQASRSASVDDHRAWIERSDAIDDRRDRVRRHRHPHAGDYCDDHLGIVSPRAARWRPNRPIVEVLHFVGAGDRYIANRFLRHFLRLGLQGGVIGGGIAMLTFGFSESIAGWFSGTPSGIIRSFAGDVCAAPVRLSGAGGAGCADRGDHRLGIDGVRCVTTLDEID